MYGYHQHCYEAPERAKQRQREAESERFRQELRLHRQRRRADQARLSLLLADARRAAGLELDS